MCAISKAIATSVRLAPCSVAICRYSAFMAYKKLYN